MLISVDEGATDGRATGSGDIEFCCTDGDEIDGDEVETHPAPSSANEETAMSANKGLSDLIFIR